jgi:hypothetical protein
LLGSLVKWPWLSWMTSSCHSLLWRS